MHTYGRSDHCKHTYGRSTPPGLYWYDICIYMYVYICTCICIICIYMYYMHIYVCICMILYWIRLGDELFYYTIHHTIPYISIIPYTPYSIFALTILTPVGPLPFVPSPVCASQTCLLCLCYVWMYSVLPTVTLLIYLIRFYQTIPVFLYSCNTIPFFLLIYLIRFLSKLYLYVHHTIPLDGDYWNYCNPCSILAPPFVPSPVCASQ